MGRSRVAEALIVTSPVGKHALARNSTSSRELLHHDLDAGDNAS
jgi:hypothetical protein